MRIHWPRRVFAQVLLTQVAITTGVVMLVTGLFLAPLSHQLDDQAMRQALSIAQTTAAEPGLVHNLTSTEPSPGGPVQAEAERIRRATGALYIVVMDTRGVRWSHTDTPQIGRHVSTDPSTALAGREIMQIDDGTLGRSARAKVPLRDAHGTIVGAVSVGIAYDSVRERLLGTIPGLLLYAGLRSPRVSSPHWPSRDVCSAAPMALRSPTSPRCWTSARPCCTASAKRFSPSTPGGGSDC